MSKRMKSRRLTDLLRALDTSVPVPERVNDVVLGRLANEVELKQMREAVASGEADAPGGDSVFVNGPNGVQ